MITEPFDMYTIRDTWIVCARCAFRPSTAYELIEHYTAEHKDTVDNPFETGTLEVQCVGGPLDRHMYQVPIMKTFFGVGPNGPLPIVMLPASRYYYRVRGNQLIWTKAP